MVKNIKSYIFLFNIPFPEVMSMTGCQIWQKGPSLLAQQIRIQQGECIVFCLFIKAIGYNFCSFEGLKDHKITLSSVADPHPNPV
jgi:hypothetical protein